VSLIIYVSSQSVSIPKYHLTFPLQLSAQGLMDAALGTYRLLRESVALQMDSSREEREEVLRLLQQFGETLFTALIPATLRFDLSQEIGVLIYPQDDWSRQIPWELLNNGTAFSALTQGVVRCAPSRSKVFYQGESREQASLKISLNAFIPLTSKAIYAVNAVEDLVCGKLNHSPQIQCEVDGNANYQSIVESLDANPDLFLFSGIAEFSNWNLAPHPQQRDQTSWLSQQFLPHLSKAVQGGLRLLLLQTSDLRAQSQMREEDPLKKYFDTGVPYIISVHGRVARERFQRYFQKLIQGLQQQKNILVAHRQALNAIHGDLALSWDWSWIQLHLNENLIQATQPTHFSPFRLQPHQASTSEGPWSNRYGFLNYRYFEGNTASLTQVLTGLAQLSMREVLCLQASPGSCPQDYLFEGLRRLDKQNDFSLSTFHYQRWGFSQNQEQLVPESRVLNRFSFLLEYESIEGCFDKAITPLKKGSQEHNRYLIVFFPPERRDPFFDHWVLNQQRKGWKVIFLATAPFSTELYLQTITLQSIEATQLNYCFGEEIPYEQPGNIPSPLPPGLKDLQLLKVLHKSDILLSESDLLKNPGVLWQKYLPHVLGQFSMNQQRIFWLLCLLRVNLPIEHLQTLLEEKDLSKDVRLLQSYDLIHSDLQRRSFRVSMSLRQCIQDTDLWGGKVLRSLAQEILQKEIALLADQPTPHQSVVTGFFYCVHALAGMGALETALKRTLQWGKRLSQLPHNYQSTALQSIRLGLELVLLSRDNGLVRKTLWSCLVIQENLPLEVETIEIYEWLLSNEDRNRNWQSVSEIQMRLSTLYARLGKVERAIGLLTSTIQLNQDLQNFSYRYQNLIRIALLLLDLGEIEKVRKLVDSADFNPQQLNRESMAKLWLIDGHLLFAEQQYDDALNSFLKSSKYQQLSVPPRLLAKTYRHLSIIYQEKGQEEPSLICLAEAANFYEDAGDRKHSLQLLEKLCKTLISRERYQDCLPHLEQLFSLVQEGNDPEYLQQLADQLGGIYYKIGDEDKSTSYYRLTQNIDQKETV